MAEMEVAIKAYNKELAAWRVACPMDKFVELRRMYDDAGVSIYAVKLSSALGRVNTVGEINWAMEVAKTLGADHITYEHPADDAHTKKLGDIAKKNKVYIGYHNHLQGTPTFWDTALEQSEYNAMNLDIGHYTATGNPDPVGFVKSKHDRIKSMHIKDRLSLENGQGYKPFGQGDTPLSELLQLMRDDNYIFTATIELNHEIPEDSNAVMEVKKCLEFCRIVLG
jgi:sugar phosphate isomerase/epimerase